MLLYQLERYEEAHEHLDRATKKLESIKDVGLIAQVNETRARVLLAEKCYPETLQVIAGVVSVLEKGGEQALLSDALRIQATAMTKINPEASLEVFKRAAKVAYDAGAITSAGLANLSMIENHWQRLSEESIFKAYDDADRFLATTQDLAAIMQLRKCARIVIRKLFGPDFDEYFNLPDVVHAYEGRFIRQALVKEKNVIIRAAKRLGISHQRLSFMLRTRHKHILNKPPIRKSVIKKKE